MMRQGSIHTSSNAVVFKDTLMEWMIIARIRLDKQCSTAYFLTFKKLLEKVSSNNLHGLIVDWSDAQIKGLKLAVGGERAEKLLKGCKVHWMRSCKWVAEKVFFSSDRQRKRSLFVQLARQIPSLSSAIGVIACFETLCDLWQCKNLQKEYAMSRTPISLIKNVTGLQPNTGLNGGQGLHT